MSVSFLSNTTDHSFSAVAPNESDFFSSARARFFWLSSSQIFLAQLEPDFFSSARALKSQLVSITTTTNDT